MSYNPKLINNLLALLLVFSCQATVPRLYGFWFLSHILKGIFYSKMIRVLQCAHLIVVKFLCLILLSIWNLSYCQLGGILFHWRFLQLVLYNIMTISVLISDKSDTNISDTFSTQCLTTNGIVADTAGLLQWQLFSPYSLLKNPSYILG